MSDSIKLPPLPAGYGPSVSAAMREYARAAVALNAPQWHKTADDPPPTENYGYLGFTSTGTLDAHFGGYIANHPDKYPFWLCFIPPLPTEPEAA